MLAWQTLTPQLRPELHKRARTGTLASRAMAIEALGYLGDPSLVEMLRENPTGFMPEESTFGEFQSLEKHLEHALLQLLKHTPTAATQLANALWQHPDTLGHLQSILNQQDYALTDPALLNNLIQSLNQLSQPKFQLEMAIEFLGHGPAALTAPHLQKLLQHPDQTLVQSARKALFRLKDPLSSAQLQQTSLTKGEKRFVFVREFLTVMSDPEWLPQLRDLILFELNTPHPDSQAIQMALKHILAAGPKYNLNVIKEIFQSVFATPATQSRNESIGLKMATSAIIQTVLDTQTPEYVGLLSQWRKSLSAQEVKHINQFLWKEKGVVLN